MNYPKLIFFLRPNQAWFLYHVLRFVPGQTAGELRQTLGNLLKMLPK